MFSLKVIDTDLFLEMPQSTRLLYYELCMRADDDGFVASPKKIMKVTGCSEDDFRILMAKKYVIPFESGVCVIIHWRVHNILRTDRYTETEYKQEKSMLVQQDNKYVIPNGNQMEPQYRLDKIKVDKVSKDNKPAKTKYDEFVSMTEDEHNKLIEQFGEQSTKDRIENLNLYKGSTGKKYASDYLTILSWDRKNKDKPSQQKQPKQTGNSNKRQYDYDELENILLGRGKS